MKRMIQFLMFSVYFILAPPAVWSLPYHFVEPPIETMVSWDLLPNGTLLVAYDLDHNGKPDFYALRVVEKSYFSTQTLQETAESFPGSLIFFVNYSVDRSYYIASMKPILFAIDVNEDGLWDLVCRAVVDGETHDDGDDTVYDTPSDVFMANMPK